jgi:hypothetical protein
MPSVPRGSLERRTELALGLDELGLWVERARRGGREMCPAASCGAQRSGQDEKRGARSGARAGTHPRV